MSGVNEANTELLVATLKSLFRCDQVSGGKAIIVRDLAGLDVDVFFFKSAFF